LRVTGQGTTNQGVLLRWTQRSRQWSRNGFLHGRRGGADEEERYWLGNEDNGASGSSYKEDDGAEMTWEGKMGASYEDITIINHHGDHLADDNNNKPTL
jgi:hypothetical protein